MTAQDPAPVTAGTTGTAPSPAPARRDTPPAGDPDVSGSHPRTRYEIRVEGILGQRWSAWFEGLQIASEGGQTVISGPLPDQPALHGVLDRVRDLGLCLISVRRADPDRAGE